MNFENDIPISAAVNAHNGTSFSPERRGEQERASYAATLSQDYTALARYANTDEKKALLEEEFARYRAGYKAKTLAHLGARSRCLSTMITGGSNFPVRRAERANNVERKRSDDLVSFRERALKAITRVLRPELAPIMAGDGDAVQRLQEKIDKAEKNQAWYTTINATIRKHAKAGADAQVKALTELVGAGIDEAKARKYLQPDFCGRIGFPSYVLTNNNANIRRMKERLAQISKAQATPESEVEGQNAKVEASPADNRVRLFFPGKPSEEIRSKLKSNGFRWSPTIGAWQAYRHNHTISLAKEVAGVPQAV